MDTEKCAALLYALEEGTLARAAEKLGYTPSGISRMIAALEEDIGFPLLRRGRGGVTPTGECETLLPAMRQMVYQAECCRQTAAALRGLGLGLFAVGLAGLLFRLAGLPRRLFVLFHRRFPL